MRTGLSASEIRQCVKKLGTSLSPVALEGAMEEMLQLMPSDEQEGGEVSHGAFEHWFLGHKTAERAAQERKLQDLFTAVDTDGSGKLERSEIALLSSQMGDKLQTFWSSKPLDAVMAELDADGDGAVLKKEKL